MKGTHERNSLEIEFCIHETIVSQKHKLYDVIILNILNPMIMNMFLSTCK